MDFAFKNVEYGEGMVSAPISPYPYNECRSGVKELRFIRIRPSSNPEDAIECELFHDTLDHVEYFVALSYEWGDPSRYDIAYMNGTVIPVAVKLLDALYHLRAANCPVLWIDVLCINQENVHEKNAHLMLMKDIYHQADMVCAYIGPASDGSDRVMKILRAIDESRREGKPWTPTNAQLVKHKEELMSFFTRSYWHRMWIIQEVALSKRLRILCGTSGVRWLAFETLVPLVFDIREFHQLDHTIKYLHEMRLRQLQKTPIGLLQLLYSSRLAKATNRRDRVYALLGLAFDNTHYVTEAHYDWSEYQICLDMTKTAIFRNRNLDIIFATTKPGSSELPSWCPDYFDCPSETIWEKMAAYIAGLDEKYRTGQNSTRWMATNSSTVSRRDLSFTNDQLLTVQGFSLGIVCSVGCTLSDPPDTVPSATPVSESKIGMASIGDVDIDEKLFMAVTRLLNIYHRTTSMSSSSGSERTRAEDNSRLSGSTRLYYHLFNFEHFHALTRSSKNQSNYEKIHQWRKRNESFMVNGENLKKRSHNLVATKLTGRIKDWLLDLRDVSPAAIWDLFAIGYAIQTKSPLPSISALNAGNYYSRMSSVLPDLEGALLSLSDLIDEGLRLATTSLGYIGWTHPSTKLGDHIYLVEGCSMPVVLRPYDDRCIETEPISDVPATNGIDTCVAASFTVVGHGIVDEAMDGSLWSSLVVNSTMERLTLR